MSSQSRIGLSEVSLTVKVGSLVQVHIGIFFSISFVDILCLLIYFFVRLMADFDFNYVIQSNKTVCPKLCLYFKGFACVMDSVREDTGG